MCLIGKPEPEASQTHLGEIHALKEKLKKQNDGLKDTKQQLRELQDRIKTEEEESKVQSSLLQGNVELRERIQADERQRLERENEAILKEKLDNLKLEIEQEKAEVKVRTCIQNVHVQLNHYVRSVEVDVTLYSTIVGMFSRTSSSY